MFHENVEDRGKKFILAINGLDGYIPLRSLISNITECGAEFAITICNLNCKLFMSLERRKP